MPNLEQARSPDEVHWRTPVAEVGLSWFAIQTWPRYEKKVAERLQDKGIKVFLPLFTERHQWRDRRALVHTPLFPHYVFVRIGETPSLRVPILRTSGVIKFVGGRSSAVPIPDRQIESIQIVMSNGLPFRPHPFLDLGRRVRIRGGSLDGIEGILVARNDDQSLLVSVQIIQRSLAIRVTGYHVEPL
jgi:transcription termination/antitermination protein NusG